MGMVRAQYFFGDGQRALVQGLGLGIVALSPVKPRQIVQACGHIGMVRAERFLPDSQRAQVEALGGWDKLMEEFAKRLEEQKKRHEGGSKWIGTAGTSPFGAYGYNPEGIRAQGEAVAYKLRQILEEK